MLGPMTYGALAQSGASSPTYAQVLMDDYGASEVWPLVDIASGTTIHAHVNAARDGVEVGWDLQNADGPVPGSLAPYSDGTNDAGNIYSSSLNSIFDWGVGCIFVWAKIADASIWTDGVTRYVVRMRFDNASQFAIQKSTTNNQIFFLARIGGTFNDFSVSGFSENDWISLALTWDTGAGASGEVIVYKNGIQTGTTKTGIGTPAEASLGTNVTNLGAATFDPPLQNWDGWLAYCAVKFGSVWTPTQILEIHNAAATSAPDP